MVKAKSCKATTLIAVASFYLCLLVGLTLFVPSQFYIQKITDTVSERTGAVVTISDVDFKFPNKIVVQGARVSHNIFGAASFNKITMKIGPKNASGEIEGGMVEDPTISNILGTTTGGINCNASAEWSFVALDKIIGTCKQQDLSLSLRGRWSQGKAFSGSLVVDTSKHPGKSIVNETLKLAGFRINENGNLERTLP